MKKVLPFIVCCLSCISAFANDGVYYTQGNQLIPANETDVSVKKEVLTLTRKENVVQVSVYYEFFNPADEKEVLVGFEAESGDYTDPISFPEHPYMHNFKVAVNGDPQTYDIAHIDFTYENGRKVAAKYVIDGQIKGMSDEECNKAIAEMECPDPFCDFVYYFKAKFRPGLNIIQHTYDYNLSCYDNGAISYIPYVLTAANRWANHQIDDFTLLIDMGDRISFNVSPTFYTSGDEWEIQGKGRYVPVAFSDIYNQTERAQFHMQHGVVRFHKDNFHPNGELYVSALTKTWHDFISFDWIKKLYMPVPIYGSIDAKDDYYFTFTPEQRRIAKNLPFAQRGYIFNSKELQDFFESTPWYIPNPDYKADVATLNENEQNWVAFWK